MVKFNCKSILFCGFLMFAAFNSFILAVEKETIKTKTQYKLGYMTEMNTYKEWLFFEVVGEPGLGLQIGIPTCTKSISISDYTILINYKTAKISQTSPIFGLGYKDMEFTGFWGIDFFTKTNHQIRFAVFLETPNLSSNITAVVVFGGFIRFN